MRVSDERLEELADYAERVVRRPPPYTFSPHEVEAIARELREARQIIKDIQTHCWANDDESACAVIAIIERSPQ